MPDNDPLQVLRSVLSRLRAQPWERDYWDASRILAAREETLARYGHVLIPDEAAKIDKESFLGFLLSLNKQHRMGLGLVGSMTADMPRLRKALAVLVDDRLPLKERLDLLRPPGGKPMVQGLGPGVITVILHFTNPSRYGILSGASERVMRRLNLYPEVSVAASIAERYEAVNPVLTHLASSLGIDLGLLDSLWWRVEPQALATKSVPQAGAR